MASEAACIATKENRWLVACRVSAVIRAHVHRLDAMHQVITQGCEGQVLEADLAELVIAARASKGVQVCRALIQLQNSSAHSLHEDSVVSDQNERGVAACQPFLHPFDSLQPLMALLRRQKLYRVHLGQGEVHKCMDHHPG